MCEMYVRKNLKFYLCQDFDTDTVVRIKIICGE